MRKPLVMTSIALGTVAAIALVWMAPRVPAMTSVATASAGSSASPAESASAAPPVKLVNRPGSGKPTAACLECGKRECGNLFSDCDALKGDATEGPAAGTPRAKLCHQMLDCARQTGCGDYVSIGCFCGNKDLGSCQAGKGTGACRAAYEAAAESNDAAVVFRRLLDGKYAISVGDPLITCEMRGCTDDCVPFFR